MVAAGLLATFVARDQTAQAGLAQTLNVLGLLEQRSPGARTGAELTKHERQRTAGLAEPEVPFAHALGPEFPREAVSEVTEGLGVPSPEQLLALAEPGKVKDFVGGLPGNGGATFAPPFTTGGIGHGGGGGGGGAGGGGDTRTGETPPGQPTLQTTGAVPEPGTWATMLLGMGLCGHALRRRKRRAAGGAGPRCEIA